MLFGILAVEKSPEESLHFVKQKGFKHLEIDLKQKHSTLESFSSLRLRKLKNLYKKYNLTISFHVPYTINLSDEVLSIRNANIKYLKKSILLASKLNATHLTTHIGYFISISSFNSKRSEALNRLISSLSELLNLCEKYRIPLALENVNPMVKDSEFFYLGDNIGDLDFIFRKLKSKYLKLCLDVGHANTNEGPIVYLKKFSKKIIAIHAHDNNGKYDEHLPIGKGTINWKILVKELKRSNILCPIIFELGKKYLLESKTTLEKYFILSLL